MSAHCCGGASLKAEISPRWRRALWIALIVNATMFAGEILMARRRTAARSWPMRSTSSGMQQTTRSRC
jgi:hypothetical protein